MSGEIWPEPRYEEKFKLQASLPKLRSEYHARSTLELTDRPKGILCCGWRQLGRVSGWTLSGGGCSPR